MDVGGFGVFGGKFILRSNSSWSVLINSLYDSFADDGTYSGSGDRLDFQSQSNDHGFSGQLNKGFIPGSSWLKVSFDFPGGSGTTFLFSR